MGQLRIIAGCWRSRKLTVPELPGLRPTPNRVRETLFNWLQNDINGARCLDLFAGSGALGFEAASRGASYVLMVDSARESLTHLNTVKKQLNAEQVECRQAKIPNHTLKFPQPFDIIFLDPPFYKNLLQETLLWLVGAGAVGAGNVQTEDTNAHDARIETLIYVEAEKQYDLTTLLSEKINPSLSEQAQVSMTLIKHQRIGHVQYGLLRVSNSSE